MRAVEVKPGVYWVGGIDWDLRNFHGYLTQRGSTYNAYLVVDEKVALVDTVKRHLFDEMLDRICDVVDPSKIDYMVSNHVEMDHSGSIPRIMELAPGAQVVASKKGAEGLKRHFKKIWRFREVGAGDTLPLGKRTLHFTPTPMVHWPDNMVTYVEGEDLLLSNDAFGQHVAGPDRFDDQMDWGILRTEAGKYYANIVMPYGQQVRRALDALSGVKIDTIAPSHGIIWRSRIPELLEEYRKWSHDETDRKALVVYDSMWGTTSAMAGQLKAGLEEEGVKVVMRNLQANHISDVITDVLNSRLILLGSPTLNSTILPTMGAFLTYLRGLRPKNRTGFAFGSYGWNGKSVDELEEAIGAMGWKMPEAGLKMRFIPDGDEMEAVREAGRRLAGHMG